MRPALQNVFLANLLEVVHSAGVDPDIQRKNRAETGQNFFRLPAFALLVDDVALQKHSASHGKLRHGLRAERAVRHFAHGNVEALRDALQKRAVARRTLRVQAKIGHRAVVQDHDLDVNPAHVADAIRVREIVQASAGVSDGLNHRTIGAQNVFQQILAVAGDAEAENFSVTNRFANLAEQTLASSIGLPLLSA